jgi:hypothetical protein
LTFIKLNAQVLRRIFLYLVVYHVPLRAHVSFCQKEILNLFIIKFI